MAEPWWKDAIFYGVDVERFCDGNGDGIGDFPGLLTKMPYLAELGVTCIWLLPFYPSADRDNGYDVTDYFHVDSKYGTLQDFLAFLHRAGEHGIRVIMDLVTHHTSDQHPWFQAARHNEKSRYRDYYIWAEHPPPTPAGKGTIFPGEETSVWTYDDVGRAHYHHRFYHFEPGLNPFNKEVRDEIGRIMDFWLSFGIAGFRVDAASHMVERPKPDMRDPEDPHDILREIYQRAKRAMPDSLLVGEVDESPKKLKQFFDGEQLDAMFSFVLDNYLILALAQERAEPIRRAIEMLPPPPKEGQWVNFLRNLDETDLERLEPEELETALKIFAPEEKMRIYGRGIRRRLAPMLGGDQRRLVLAYSLLFSLPGAPLFVYGDEIGMGDDLACQGRNAVRTPMQWSRDTNGGFSKAPTKKLVQQVIDTGPFAYRKINVEDQWEKPDSLLSEIKRLVHLRREHTVIGQGKVEFLESGSDHVLAHRYQTKNGPLAMLHNLRGRPEKLTIQMDPGSKGEIRSLFGGEVSTPENGRLMIELEPYGARWLGRNGSDR